MPEDAKPAAPSERQGRILLNVFGRTDVGQIREHNEDSFLVADLTRASRPLTEPRGEQVVGARGTLLGVCDGMGGAAAGEVASRLAVEIIYEKLASGDPPADHDELARRLVSAVEEAGVRIFTEARADRTRRGMGTTATIAALIDGRLFVAQVGDSRGYILRRGNFVQITRDQSLVNQLIEAGQLTEEEAETFEHNNIILQALGTADTVQVDLTYADLRRGDTIVLCSDGLSGMVRAEEIRDVLLELQDPEQACMALTERANLAGGHDNITVIVARLEGDGLPDPVEDDEPLGYRKYALPEVASPEKTLPSPPMAPDSVPPSSGGAPSSKAEARGGPVQSETQGRAEGPATGAESTPSGSAGAKAGAPPRPGRGAPASSGYDSDQDPVQIPTTGVPPSIVGVMVLGAMAVAAVMGFLLLR